MDTFLPFTRPTLNDDAMQGVTEVLQSGWITSGPKVAAFEQALADYLGGARKVRTVSSATSALKLALVLAGVGAGDEVIVPAMTFAATANVVVHLGANPVFVDVDLHTRNLIPEQVEAAITERTRAIMPVHFAGLAVDCEAIMAIAQRHDLRIIEDAAHAIGGGYKGRKIGAFGDLVCFSFHANKNLTTIEGGALSVADEDTAAQLEKLRFHGIEKFSDGSMDVSVAGGKHNMTDVSASIGLSQLKQLDGFNQQRHALAARYFERLNNNNAFVLPARGHDDHCWHMFAPLIAFDRLGITFSRFREQMAAQNIGIGKHYPALHLFSLYRAMGYGEGQFPNAERIGHETVTLPLFPAMTIDDVDRVCDALHTVIKD